MSKEYVYLIAAEDEFGSISECKIGISNDPKRRLRRLQTGNPKKLILVNSVPGDRALEREFHIMCESYRLNGEWFTDEALDIVDAEMNSMKAPSLVDSHELTIDISLKDGKVNISIPAEKVLDLFASSQKEQKWITEEEYE